ncbi:hypothetical protein RJ640_005927 [Escallonia rubra]|uniref:Uncharacterized protein n=1 Tax=Escallonia rubra TaxID=112253 RepID=A0AA88RF20_9ASTE|nr:hypothetical protein RJ640_005927 [Escallonia rubra]
MEACRPNEMPSIRFPLQNEHAKIRHRDTRIRHFTSSVPKFTVHASAKEGQVVKSSGKVILVCSAITVVLATANRVLYKLALVPMKEYPFMLAQINTFGCAAIATDDNPRTKQARTSNSKEGCLIYVVKFGVACSVGSPQERMRSSHAIHDRVAFS